MENNPYEAPESDNSRPSLAGSVSAAVIDQLKRTKGWALFIGILSFIGAAFMVLAGIVMMVAGGAIFSQTMGPAGVGMGIGMGIFYIVLALIYIYPGLKLVQYSSSIGRLTLSGSEDDLITALDKQRQFWKFLGIAVIAIFVLYILIMIVAMVAGATGFSALNQM